MTMSTDAAELFAPWDMPVDSWQKLQTSIIELTSMYASGAFVWRGQSDAAWGLHSALSRTLADVIGRHPRRANWSRVKPVAALYVSSASTPVGQGHVHVAKTEPYEMACRIPLESTPRLPRGRPARMAPGCERSSRYPGVCDSKWRGSPRAPARIAT